ncbi:MAG: M15 family metallopeptidase [Eubacteriales bacterium]|nr:M15 family metallopeptidase [Eubacteriales bacterium]
MKKRPPAYKSSLILSITATLLVLLTTLFIMRPSLAKKLQHKLYRAQSQDRHQLREVPAGDRLDLGNRLYLLDQMKAGDSPFTSAPTLLLVSASHPLPSLFEAEIIEDPLTELKMSPYLAPNFTDLSQAVSQEFGEKLYVSSFYRTDQEQEEIWAASPDLALPSGCSEHQTGLALDVYVFQFAGANFINAPAGFWVNENAWRYGFIVRYPLGREDLTGVPFEPWHLRYVGKPHAEIMEVHGWVLEEYLQNLQEDRLYQFGDYFLLRSSRTEFYLPDSGHPIYFSPDNLGSYVMWGLLTP